jgi:hypothetical protein
MKKLLPVFHKSGHHRYPENLSTNFIEYPMTMQILLMWNDAIFSLQKVKTLSSRYQVAYSIKHISTFLIHTRRETT